MAKRSRYDLHIKVAGDSRDFYVLRRRWVDGGFECNCPQWNEMRKQCKHIERNLPLLSQVPSVLNPLDKAIARAVNNFTFYIPNVELLIERIRREVRELLRGTQD